MTDNKNISLQSKRHVTMHAQMAPSRKDMECGLGVCRPNCMKPCAKIAVFTGFYSMAGLFTSTVSLYITSQITTLEKYFGFSSAETGFLLSCNDIGFLLTTLFISYQARRMHIPRTLSLSTMFFGISGLICTLAYVTSPTFMKESEGLQKVEKTFNLSVTYNTTNFQGGQLCDGVNKTENCDDVNNAKMKLGAPTEFSKVALMILALGMILQGFAKAPRQPFVTCYIDDNVKKTKTALYLGIIMGLGIFGPAIAFGTGGLFTKIFITLEEVNIGPRDPRWVGAWWLGFLVFGCLGIISGVPLMFFPKRLKPKTQKTKDIVPRSGLKETIIGVFKGLWKLLGNKLYMLVLLATCMTLFVVSGIVAFMPKYMEIQFSIPAWKSNIAMGVLAVVAAALGSFLGGFITSKLKLSPVACARLILGISCFALIVPVTGYFFGCENLVIIGYNFPRKTSSNNSMASNCTSDCACENTDYFPVCGSDGQNYFSPCHAGCTDLTDKLYTSCGCVGKNGTATPGICQTTCTMFYPYLALCFVGGLVATLASLPSIIFSIRSVTEKEKSLALGFSSFMQTLLGWFLGPVVNGKIVDTSCMVWSSSCVGRGACVLYDIEDLRLKRHALELCVKILVVILHATMLWFATKKDWGDVDVNIEKPEVESLMHPNENGTTKDLWIDNVDPVFTKTKK